MNRILWIASFELPLVSDYLHRNQNVTGGWIDALYQTIRHTNAYEIAICCPSNQIPMGKYAMNDTVVYVITYDVQSAEINIRNAIDDFCPDIVHIWGAEVSFSLPAVKAFNRKDRTVVHIQGSAIRCHNVLCVNVPWCVKNIPTLGEWLRHGGIRQNLRQLFSRGETEKQVLSLCGHFLGRTEFDKALCEEFASSGHYHHCGEIMRAPFYTQSRDDGHVKQHRLFFSQGGKPIKGFHLFLQSLKQLKYLYEDIEVLVAGDDIYHYNKKRLEDKKYWKYLRKLIHNYGLEQNVKFIGYLSAENMTAEMAGSAVFISASFCENSPNSVCEAMLLGLPVIASDVGGVSDIITHKVDGFLYPLTEPYLLTHYVRMLFENPSLASEIANNAKSSIRKKCLPGVVSSEVLAAYNTILGDSP